MLKLGGALVTGAGARLGRAMAEALGRAGWCVAVHYRSSSAGAKGTAATITAAGGMAELVQADLADTVDCGQLIERATRAIDMPLSLLVNSASTFDDDSALTFTDHSWATHFDTNLKAPVRLAQSFAQALPKGMPGLIVNLVDQRVWKLNPQFFTYTLSKSALWTATRTLAQALAPNIRVNAIGPGPTLSSIHQNKAIFDAEKAATLTGQGSTPEEIVRALFYLMEASSVTGQMIASDGGQHLLWQTPDITMED